MNKFLDGLKDETNFTFTENGALTHKTTKSDLLDMFAMGAAYRNRSDEDVIILFKNAYKENPVYALKCLFYIRDIRGGQGERRFFRVCMQWLANEDTAAAARNLPYVAEFGRWDDFYCFVGTPLEKDAFDFIKNQLCLDMQCETPSLLAKWLKSENASSCETKRLANITREYFGMTHKQYRKTLAILRTKINIVEKLMSENRWDEIEFDKIPSRAGMIYKNVFARKDVIKAKFEAFAKDKTTTVNAKALYPYECVHEALKLKWSLYNKTEDANRLMVNKYWDNLTDYFNGAKFNALAVVDVSGSMTGTPMEVAISLGMYCADKAEGPFKDHFITFSGNPELVKVEGCDFCDKVWRMSGADWGMNTNVEAVFDLMLNTAIKNNCSEDELPENIIIISDMEFDACATCGSPMADRYAYRHTPLVDKETLFDKIAEKWYLAGYQMPHLIFWNVDARQNNIPVIGNGWVSYVSGMSPVIFETIMSGKAGYDLMMEKLDSERYANIK